jgi:hypothetical protein
MVKDGPGVIPDQVCAALKMAACELNLKRWDSMPIVSVICDGIIETKWNTHSIGSRSGVLFRTEIESSIGMYKINFLLGIADLERGTEVLREMEEEEDGVWITNAGKLPCTELYRFHDLHKTARRMN